MRIIRFLLKCISALLFLIIAAVVLLFLLPSAQTAIARQWIPSDPGVTPQLDYLKVSLGGVEARGFATTISNVKIDLQSASAQLSLWKLLFSQTAHITTAQISGIRVDLSEKSTVDSEEEESQSEPVDLSQITWPANLKIDSVEVDAEVVLDSQQTAKLQLVGKDIQVESDSKIQYSVWYQNKGKEIAITNGEIHGQLQSRIDASGIPQEIRADTQITASGADFQKPIRLDLSLFTPQLSSKTLQLRLASPDLPSNTPLPLQLDMRYLENQGTISGSFQIAINSADWSAHLPEQLRSLVAQVQSKGEFVYSAESQTGSVQSTGNILSSGLEKIFPQIPGFAQQINAQWDLSAEALPSQELQIHKLQIQASLPIAGADIGLSPSAPLKIPVNAPQSTLDQPLPPLRLSFNNLSSELLKEFLPQDWKVGFQPIQGHLDITLHSLNSVAIQTPAAIAIRSFTLSSPVTPALQPLDLTISPNIQYKDSGLQVAWKLQASPSATTAPRSNSLGIQMQWSGEGLWQPQGHFSVQHNLNSTVTGLAVLAPELAAIQSLSVVSQADIQGEIQESGLRANIRSLSNRVGQGGQDWFALRSTSPWSVQVLQGETLPKFENLQLELQILDLPLQLVRAFVPELQASASSSRGKFLLQSKGKGWVLQNEEPLSFKQLSIRWNQEPWLQGINATATLNASLDGQQQLQLQIPSLSVSEVRGDILNLQSQIAAQLGNETEIPWEFSASVSANLAMARNQPLLRTFLENVMSGQSRINIKGRYQKQIQIEGNVEAQNLRNASSLSPKSLTSSFLVQFDPSQGSGQIQLPASIKANGNTSTLALNSRFQLPSERHNGTVQLDIKGEEIQVSDILDLVETFKPQTQQQQQQVAAAATQARPSLTRSTSSTQAQAPVRKAPSQPDRQAAWAGWDGKVTVSAKKVVLPNGDPLEDLNGIVNLTPSRAAVESFTGKLQGAPASLQAAIDFVPNASNPYRTTGKLSISNLNTSGFFKGAQLPMLSTRLNANGNIQGMAPNLSELADTLQGKLIVEGGEGKFRAFAGKPVLNNIASALGDLGGLIFGGQDVLPPELRALERLSSILSEIPFNEIRFEAVRGEDLDIQMKEIRITGNDIQLKGQGIIINQIGTPIMEQPLQMAFSMDLRGTTADIFQQAGLLKALPENTPLQQFRTLDFPMQISGSLGNVDASQIWKRLVDEATNMLSGSKSKSNNKTSGNSNEKSPANSSRNPLDDILRGILK
jgi:hypothetical protein